MNFKKIIGLAKQGLELANEYGPQIAAVGSAVCFIGGVIFAAKESPAAFEALEEKMAENEDMNVVEQVATVASRMPKTIAATVSGLLLHIFAWKKILGKLATVTGIAAIAKQENAGIIEAAKEVVGPDKAKEIVQVKDQIVSEQNGGSWSVDATGADAKRTVMYPFTFYPFAITHWMTLDDFERGHRESVKTLAENEELSAYDYFDKFKDCEKPTLNCGWGCEGRSCGASPSDILRWAGDELRYDMEVQMYKEKYPGYRITFINQPSEPIEDR